MKDITLCPRCGAENAAGAMNCMVCRINLAFAQEHPAEIRRIRLEDGAGKPWPKDAGGETASDEGPMLMPGLLLLGSFVFAFCLGEAVHELGHFLVHRAYGVNVGIKLDPFGGSMILNGASASLEIWGITSLGGPLLNLLAGTALTLALWRIRRPALLPLLLWGPIVLVQEGVTFSLGLLTPGGDANLIVEWGVPAVVLISLGIFFLASGVFLIGRLLPLVGLSPEDSFSRKFIIVAGGMVSFLVIRMLISGLRSPNQFTENTVPLLFSLLLATIVVLLFRPFHAILGRMSETEPALVTRPAVVPSTLLAVGMVLFQLLLLN